MERCCIAFRRSADPEDCAYLDGLVQKKVPNREILRASYRFDSLPDEPAAKAFSEDAERWLRISRSLPPRLRDAVQFLLDQKGLPQEELAMEIGVARSAVNKWLAEEKTSLRHIVAICIALNLRWDISSRILQDNGYSLGCHGKRSCFGRCSCRRTG